MRGSSLSDRKCGTVRRSVAFGLIVSLSLGACSPDPERLTCTPPIPTGTFPDEIEEASGVVASRRYPGVLWIIEDSGHPNDLIAIDSTGAVLGRVKVAGAQNIDWEDLALGPCPEGSCLYIPDTGDNLLSRSDPVIYRVPEPSPDDEVTAKAIAFPIRYPDGPRDVEAFFITPDGVPYLISKGRKHPVEVYEYPLPLRPDTTIEVIEVERLTSSGVPLPNQVTGADITPDGRWIGVRTYSSLQLYRFGDNGMLLPQLPGNGIDLEPLGEPQGEGVAIRDDGTIFLVSEGGPPGVPGIVGRLECELR